MAKKPANRTRRGSNTELPTEPLWNLRDADAEAALLTGRHARALETILGPEQYDELRQLAREAEAARTRGGPRVLILPGIMGSKLGVRRMVLDDLYWFDPLDWTFGVARRLSLDSTEKKVVPLGVFLFAYLRLKLSLRRDGFDADFYPFDWRQSLRDLGRQLATHLTQKETAKEVSLVAHSMGGLVSRAALRADAAASKRIRRLIMLGTPNHGSFEPVQALRGVHDLVKKAAALDLSQNTDELVTRVFASFPGLYQMLPSSARFAAINFFDPQVWPTKGPKVRRALLADAATIQDDLAAADERFRLIAGINQETVVSARSIGGEFEFGRSGAGDGTVPWDFARLDGVSTWFVEEQHGSLPNNRAVIRATSDLLAQGTTSALDHILPPIRRATTRAVSESSLRQIAPFDGRRREDLRAAELREILRTFVAPDATPETSVAPAAAAPLDIEHRPWQRLTIGRVHQHRLEIHLYAGSITEVDARAYVLGLFREVAPAGAARAIDQYLDGAIAELTRRRMFSGGVGEVFILPANRRQLRADMILFAGLGYFDGFNDEVQQITAENVVRTFVRTNVEDFATVLIGAGSGVPTARGLANLLQGFVRGKLDADARRNLRRVTLCETDPARYREIRDELFRLAGTPLFADIEVSFTEIPVRETPSVIAPLRRAERDATYDPTYLLVRQETVNTQRIEFRATVLSAKAKAALFTATQIVAKQDLHTLLKKVESNAFEKQVDAFGGELAGLVLAEHLRDLLQTLREQHLVIVHDAESSRLPWETLRIGDWAPALTHGMSRRYMANNLSIAKYLEQRVHDGALDLLLVVDPTEDLPGAAKEGRRIQALFQDRAAVRMDVLEGPQATRRALLSALTSGQYDAVHYAGHAYFDAQHISRSGLVCHGHEYVTGADLSTVGNLPALMVFNACESGRVRTTPKDKKDRSLDMARRIERNVGLAEAFLRGGVANYIGTYWPVGDAAAEAFAQSFYTGLLAGAPVGAALIAARGTVRTKVKSVDWADYIHYGDFNFVLKEPS